METLTAYSRDLLEVKAFLLDHGFKKAVEVLDTQQQAIAEQIIGAAFSVQRSRDVTRGAKRELILFRKIRTEMNLSAEEFAREVAKFHSQDLSAQTKAWRERQNAFAKAQMRPSDFRLWQQGSMNCDLMTNFEKENPQPAHQKINLELIMSIERDRPHRETRKPALVEVFERFFEAKTGFCLSWEQLLAEVGPRDPRAAQAAYLEKKKKTKQMPDSSDAEAVSDNPLFKTLRDVPASGEVISDGA